VCVCMRVCMHASSASVYACTSVQVQACLCICVCLVVLMMSWLIVCAPHSTPRLYKGTCLCCVDAWSRKGTSKLSLKRGHKPNRSESTISILARAIFDIYIYIIVLYSAISKRQSLNNRQMQQHVVIKCADTHVACLRSCACASKQKQKQREGREESRYGMAYAREIE